MKAAPSLNCVHCDKPHGKPLRWIFESCDACDAKTDQEMIDASACLTTASCPRCDLLFSVEPQPALTDAEREAVEQSIDAANGMILAEPWAIDTLRNLLERLK